MEKKSIHFIGIGGTGLSAIARVLLESGYLVSGSDRQMSHLFHELQMAGARVVIGHYPENIAGAELVIRSSAIPDDHVEVQAAMNAGIPVIKRSEFLPQLLAGKQAIAVAGTHGKTTTTGMLAWILSAMGLDPSFIVGGSVENLGVNARAGKGVFFVIEADEYDHMFLGINPQVALVTNVEYDHPDCFPCPDIFYQAFVDFCRGIQPQGFLIACGENEGSMRLATEMMTECTTYTYGLNHINQKRFLNYQGVNITKNSVGCYSYKVLKNGEELTEIQLAVPGRHNALNALGALAVIDVLDLPVSEAAQYISQYRGVGRRFEIQGEADGVIFIDDYAHHPTEIKVTLAAARGRFTENRIIAVWQPHTYSRVQALWDGFSTAFADADLVIVTDIFAAREQTPQDFLMAQMVRQIQHPRVEFQETLLDASNYLLKEVNPGDVVLVLSAGDANKISQTVIRGLRIKGKIA
ncbi:MAG: UDP-N-acetylmuramate--L-alanine ligase [Anaerolineales bacterium]|nr:UDP-N-acetylmuramate--L-alanine ligase [Anaerolineales bacterium]